VTGGVSLITPGVSDHAATGTALGGGQRAAGLGVDTFERRLQPFISACRREIASPQTSPRGL